MMEQSRTAFPAEPRIECKDCSYFSVCTGQRLEIEPEDESNE
jgi:CRISPR/Cas system-associated exonuclease Cas4 (RecB family)